MPGPLTNLTQGAFGYIGRALASVGRAADSTPAYQIRMGRYGEQYVLGLVPDLNQLADEGCFFVASNGQTGIATAAAPTSFSATNPFVTIYNSDATGGKRIYLDDVTLIATAAGTAGASLQMAVVVDSGNRFTSGGTALTPVNANMDDGTKSIAVVNVGNLTASAATGQARTLVGNRWLKGAIPVAGDEYVMKFAGVDATAYLNLQNTITKTGVALPPVVIGPNQTALIYIWLPSQSAASSYEPEINWWER